MAVAPLPVMQAELASLLGQMCEAAATALRHATAALQDGRERLAVQVEQDDAAIDALRARIEHTALSAMALHTPVAGDLRSLVSAIRCAGDLERMGDLAAHVARAVQRGCATTIPPETRAIFVEMGRRGAEMSDKAATIARTHDVVLALELRADDDASDRLLRDVFELLLAPTWTHGVGAAVEVTLLARFYERFADHAVAVANEIVYAVTGQTPEVVEAALDTPDPR